jgi:hypothetical protein
MNVRAVHLQGEMIWANFRQLRSFNFLQFYGNYTSTLNCGRLFPLKIVALNLAKNVFFAALWAILSQRHLVALFTFFRGIRVSFRTCFRSGKSCTGKRLFA